MKRQLLIAWTLMLLGTATGVAQKRVYIPEDLRGMNLESDTSKWCWRRSAETRDLIFMWERGFGSDLQNPPRLEGKPMAFNLPVLMERVQSFYTFFRDTLGFANKPMSKADRYKMMVMVMYSLDGTAYGGTYDNYIGALWVAPNRIQDKTMNCMAHELGHSFQSQIMADSVGQCWGGTGFFEMASQWMLWQVNPWWLRDENYHFEAFKTLTHKAYLAMDNIYHSPYVIQWWSDLHGRKSIGGLLPRAAPWLSASGRFRLQSCPHRDAPLCLHLADTSRHAARRLVPPQDHPRRLWLPHHPPAHPPADDRQGEGSQRDVGSCGHRARRRNRLR